ncbi:hypothetical protein V1514DRAFT_304400 [Lipomyces japonicus]|uniref:uncharacterized protein n=1 Tax=Lipomyces japonicus TaxID=56871 RepID=UPI0034CD04B8
MVLHSLALHRKSPKLKPSVNGGFSPLNDKFPQLPQVSGEVLPSFRVLNVAVNSDSSSPLSSPTGSHQGNFYSSPLTTPGSGGFTSAPFQNKSESLPSSPISGTGEQFPSSLVFRELDRYPKIVRPSISSSTSPGPMSPSTTGGFPRRQSSVKSSHSLLSQTSPVSVRFPVPLREDITEVPESHSAPESNASFHTTVDSIDSTNEGSQKSFSARSFAPSDVSGYSSSTSFPLEAVQVRLSSGYPSPVTTPPKNRVGNNESPSRFISSTENKILGIDDLAAEDDYVDDDDDDFDVPESRRRLKLKGGVDSLLNKTQKGIKRFHIPEQIKTVSNETFLSIKSGLSVNSPVDKSAAQYNYSLVDTLQAELGQVSTELANSIKRELDLEMLLNKYATAEDEPDDLTDSNSSIIDEESDEQDHLRRPIHFSQHRISKLEQKLRFEQQEKARLQLEFQATLDKERIGRKESDGQRRKLEEQLKRFKTGKINSSDFDQSENVHALELALEDAQRKLYNERLNAQNLEFMLNGIREELQEMSDKSPMERQARARSSIASFTVLTKISPNSNRQSQSDTEVLNDKVADLEGQRDALQDALRSLRQRQDLQEKNYELKVKSMQSQLERAKEISKALVARKFLHQQDLSSVDGQLRNLKLELSNAHDEKILLSDDLAGLKQKMAGLKDIVDSNSAHNDQLARIAELNQKLEKSNQQILILSSDFDRERQDTKALVESLEDRALQAENQQRMANDIAEEHKTLMRTLSSNRKQMHEEHTKMTTDLEGSTKKLQEFAAEIQRHVEVNRNFASKFQSLGSTQ